VRTKIPLFFPYNESPVLKNDVVLSALRVGVWDYMVADSFFYFLIAYFDLRFISSRLFFSSTACRIHSEGLPTVLRYLSWSVVRRTP